jgi:hypothetical protein
MASSTSSTIGIVMTSGDVQVNGSRVPGNSAIFSGNLISSGEMASNLQFADGTSAVMKPGASMTVYREHSVLQRGVAMQRRADKHPLIANGLRVSATTSNAVVFVGVKDASHMEVASQGGESDVWTPGGNLVARVGSGKTLSFAIAQATPDQEKKITLCGDLDEGNLLTDGQNGVTYKLQGSNITSLVGKRVKVSGTVAGTSASGSEPEPLAILSIKKWDRNKECDAAAIWWTNKSIALLVFIGFGGTLIGLGAAGDLGTSPAPNGVAPTGPFPVTPTTP